MQNRQKIVELLQFQKHHRDFIESYAAQMNLDRSNSDHSELNRTSAEFGSSTNPNQIKALNRTEREDETIETMAAAFAQEV